MPNPHYIPEEFRTEFSTNVEYAIQQDQSVLFPKAKADNFKGKEKVYTKQESTSMERRTGRLRQTVLSEATFQNRKAYKEEFVKHFVFDEWDEELLGELGRPDSETIQTLKMAWERAKDDAIISASTGIVYGGVRPHTTEIPLPDTQKVAVGYKGPGVATANIGLIPQKLIRACSIFEENELDPLRYDTYVTINPKAKESLLQAVEAAPNEVWAKMCIPWLEGRESKLFGLIPVMTNRLALDSGTDVDTLFAWNKMQGIWTASEKLTIKIDVRPDLEHALQISAYGQLSAHRHDELAVVQISCDRSPA